MALTFQNLCQPKLLTTLSRAHGAGPNGQRIIIRPLGHHRARLDSTPSALSKSWCDSGRRRQARAA